MQNVVIAGGTSGMGFATAKLLIARGFSVIILGRDIEKLNQALQELGSNARGKSVDATDSETLKQSIAEIGRIDHLVVALSGGKGIGRFSELNLNDLRQGFEGKFFPQLQVAQAVLPYIATKGSITFITSISSRSKAIGTAGLGAINGAIEIMVPTLAKELKPLRINAVAPGVINTTWWDFLPPERKQETFSQYNETIPLGRIGEPDDVAGLIATLIENTYITGQVIAVDGGLSLI
ncbi:NAD(P)-dependent dehydrogenase (short-subunit alcohol dehydrogenase family) [Mucilaginibacter frigoritolerans]|uniref:NAD(P)-dependent dehydrogenase (Short-subunit alcohol dehydrogenase family) n=1 Tax=Mucilaginibacter frigoritolerans TaxID=652788 RepID=A0A562UC91_9SPHI|nr:SDR family oxidoreductase [Mucilaginibacter frigoritolerans]TWJ03450.1 NAD(P)-dependent dehydrogenase (short-subunit alcohol dehydrogenase family) [Mucilaginibacter frigoritolerans]